jgi:hypothetical protein
MIMKGKNRCFGHRNCLGSTSIFCKSQLFSIEKFIKQILNLRLVNRIASFRTLHHSLRKKFNIQGNQKILMQQIKPIRR